MAATKFTGTIKINEIGPYHIGDIVHVSATIQPVGTIPWGYLALVDSAGNLIGQGWDRLDISNEFTLTPPRDADKVTQIVLQLLVWNAKRQIFYAPVATVKYPIG